MNTDLNEFYKDKELYVKELSDIDPNDEHIDKKFKEVKDRYKDRIRKYIPTCLNIINSAFNTKYSIYKVGKDFDSSFNVIETNVKKTKEEIISEINYYLSTNAYGNNDQMNLVLEILSTYVDEEEMDAQRKRMLETREVVGTSIITNVPVMESRQAVMSEPEIPASTYNPYAGQAYVSESEMVSDPIVEASIQNTIASNNVGMDIFGVNTGFRNENDNLDESLVTNYSTGTMDIFSSNNK